MSLFNLVEVMKTSEKETQSIYPMDNLEEAVARMHFDFGGMLKSDDTMGAYCIVINNSTGQREDVAQWGEGVRERVYTHNDYENDNIAPYDSSKLAIGNYHTKIANQRNHEGCKVAVTIRVGTTGAIAECNIWNAPTQEEQPQEQGE